MPSTYRSSSARVLYVAHHPFEFYESQGRLKELLRWRSCRAMIVASLTGRVQCPSCSRVRAVVEDPPVASVRVSGGKAVTNVQAQAYRDAYRRALEDPEGFWGERAAALSGSAAGQGARCDSGPRCTLVHGRAGINRPVNERRCSALGLPTAGQGPRHVTACDTGAAREPAYSGARVASEHLVQRRSQTSAAARSPRSLPGPRAHGDRRLGRLVPARSSPLCRHSRETEATGGSSTTARTLSRRDTHPSSQRCDDHSAAACRQRKSSFNRPCDS